MRAPIRARRLACIALLCTAAFAAAQASDAGDALGVGLVPPTAARFADPAWYDLLAVRWATDATGARVLELELAAIDPDAPLLQPIVEAYLMDPEALGRSALPGTGLVAPEEAGWAVAVRVAGGDAWAWTAELETPLRARALASEVVGRTVRLAWPDDLPVEGSWVAVSGVYDPFSESGWRPFAEEASPWAFAGPSATPPVVSVVPGGDEALLRLHATASLPPGEARGFRAAASPWWWLMGAGMILVLAGVAWRWRSRPPQAAAPDPTPAPVAYPAEPPMLIGDEDVAAAAEDGEGGGQSDAAERSVAAEAETSDRAADAEAPSDEASSTERTTRAPSPASRSAKRS